MPNPKSGTVTADVATAVKEVKAGKIEFRVDKAGAVHATVGKANFEKEKFAEKRQSVLGHHRPSQTRDREGAIRKSIAVSSTMGPGVHIDRGVVQV